MKALVLSTNKATGITTLRLENGSDAAGIHAPGIIARFLGFNLSVWPEDNTFVETLSSQEPYIFISIPTDGGADVLDTKQAVDGPDMGEGELGQAYRSHRPPVDILEGEIDWSNFMNVGISLLTGIARLKGGEGAVVEASIIDDTVRIINRNFRHIFPGGEFRAVTDGDKFSVVYEMSGQPYEALAFSKEFSDKFGYSETGLEEENITKRSPEAERAIQFIQPRMQMFAGYLGHFINLFVVDPLQTISSEMPNLCGRGKVHINEDGSIAASSIMEVRMEKVIRMAVPQRKKAEWDPEGDPFSKFGNDPSFNMPAPTNSLSSDGYALRSYVRWFHNALSLGRIRHQSDDYKILEETDQLDEGDDPHINGNSQRAGTTREPVYCYSCVALLRDGGTLTVDGYGNAVHTGEMGINFHSSTSINFYAPLDINMVCKRFYLRTVDRMEMTSTEGDIKLASKFGAGIYSERNGIILQSNQSATSDLGELNPEAPEGYEGDPDGYVHGIQLRSRSAPITTESRHLSFNVSRFLNIRASAVKIVTGTFTIFNLQNVARFISGAVTEIWGMVRGRGMAFFDDVLIKRRRSTPGLVGVLPDSFEFPEESDPATYVDPPFYQLPQSFEFSDFSFYEEYDKTFFDSFCHQFLEKKEWEDSAERIQEVFEGLTLKTGKTLNSPKESRPCFPGNQATFFKVIDPGPTLNKPAGPPGEQTAELQPTTFTHKYFEEEE